MGTRSWVWLTCQLYANRIGQSFRKCGLSPLLTVHRAGGGSHMSVLRRRRHGGPERRAQLRTDFLVGNSLPRSQERAVPLTYVLDSAAGQRSGILPALPIRRWQRVTTEDMFALLMKDFEAKGATVGHAYPRLFSPARGRAPFGMTRILWITLLLSAVPPAVRGWSA